MMHSIGAGRSRWLLLLALAAPRIAQATPQTALAAPQSALAAPQSAMQAQGDRAATYNVTWKTPGRDHRDSMPLGNGDIGANVWTEPNGDVVLLISKTDAWSENGQLIKIGQVRLRLSPTPFAASPDFVQTLDVRHGHLLIQAGAAQRLDVWIDANHPAIHIDYQTSQSASLEASLELWRTAQREISSSTEEARLSLRELASEPGGTIRFDPDTVLSPDHNSIRWAHENRRSMYPSIFANQHLQSLLSKYPDPLLHRVSGAMMQGTGLASVGDRTLRAKTDRTEGSLDIVVLTEQAPSIAAWASDAKKLAAQVSRLPREAARRAHDQWWSDFWQRSWINVSGSKEADAVTQGYAMQRWMVAASGRGAQPLKYNGAIFTVGDYGGDGKPSAKPYDPAKGLMNEDYRAWGSNYWFQNQRQVYWPLIASGDADLLAPFFAMYRRDLALEQDRNQLYFHHAGAAFPETMYFWGLPNNNDFGWANNDVTMKNAWIRWHINNGLELTLMMLDSFAQTQDAAFARDTLLPIADNVTAYFDEHWKHVDGGLRFTPSQSLETDRPATDPAPDVDGLWAVLPRLLALPEDLTSATQRTRWKAMLSELPPVPQGTTDAAGKHPAVPAAQDPAGKPILLTAAQWTPSGPNNKAGNVENPELYGVFPYQLFGVGLPGLELGRNTFAARRFVSSTCWGQDGEDAATLGLAAQAQKEAIANFTAYGLERFKWFWKRGHDWEPDMDNGGAGMTILQRMLLQVRGDHLLLLPAWPAAWNVDFKLHAPQNTTIEGSFRDGKLQTVSVTPKSRMKDLVILQPQ